MGARSKRRKEWTLEVDAQDSCAVGHKTSCLREILRGALRLFKGTRDECRLKGDHSIAHQSAGHLDDVIHRGIQQINAGVPVELRVNESRNRNASTRSRQSHRHDEAVTHRDVALDEFAVDKGGGDAETRPTSMRQRRASGGSAKRIQCRAKSALVESEALASLLRIELSDDHGRSDLGLPPTRFKCTSRFF